MVERPGEKLLPMTILDGMIFVAGCAVSIWLLASVKDEVYLLPPRERLDWLVLTAFVEYGPTIVGPLVLFLQFIRGRRQRLFVGEVAWLVIGIELVPFVLFWAAGRVSSSLPHWFDTVGRWYGDGWLFHGSPVLVFLCAAGALVWHFRTGRPRHWSHRVGLGIAVAQCVPSGLLIIEWFH